MVKQMMLSTRASCNTHGQNSSYFLGWQEYEKNPYDPSLNPKGIIQMGLAENQLSLDLLESWLATHPDAASFNHDGASVFRKLALFQDYHGLPAFKNALAQFMSDQILTKVAFNPDSLVLTAGATSANETIIFCLADPGEAFLVPAPYYPGFDRDLKWRTGVEIIPIQCTSSSGFRITKPALEEAYHLAGKLNMRVKGVLITNPSNPLGTTTTREELDILFDFIAAKHIHLVSDEVYSGTAFASPDFTSVAEVVTVRPDAAVIGRRVHIVYSLSKDLGIPGFRVGAVYSTDKAVVSAATKMSSFGLVSSHTQHLLSLMLADEGFRREYIEENRRRIKERREAMAAGLRRAGIGCLEGNAGLFCWVDMRHLMRRKGFEGEMELWKEMVYEVGLNVSPGSSCHCCEPGWFRMCFANMSEETLELAMERLKLYVDAGGLRRRRRRGGGDGRQSRVGLVVKWMVRLTNVSDPRSDR